MIRTCIKCRDNAVSDADAVRESVLRTERHALRADEYFAAELRERARIRCELQHAGYCETCAALACSEAREAEAIGGINEEAN